MSRTVCVVITARPSYSRVRTALAAIDAHPDLELQLVVASSALLDRYGNAVNQIEADGFHIDERVYTVIEGENPTTMAKSTGLGLLELSSVLDNLRPDVVVTIADRYETIATAVAATYQNIPLAHLQGGEITGSIDEKVRHAVTKLADLHLVSTELAAERVIRMGEDPGSVFVTGCPSIDLAAEILDAPDLDFDPIERYGGVGDSLDLSDGYLVVLQHPVTTEYRQARHDVLETLHAVEPGRPAGAVVLAQPRRRHRRHVERHPVLPGVVPRRRAASPPALLQEHGAHRLLAPGLQQPVPGGELERGHPRVLLPRHPGGQHRHPPGGSRARRQRGRRGL